MARFFGCGIGSNKINLFVLKGYCFMKLRINLLSLKTSDVASLKQFCKDYKTNLSAVASLKEFCKVCENSPSAQASLKYFCKVC